MLIKVGDTVQVVCGNDSGETGKVLSVDGKSGKLIVEGVNKVYKLVRPSQKNPRGGKLSKEMPIDASNVMVVDPQSGEPTRIGVRYKQDGTKERYAKKSGTSIDDLSPPRKAYASS